jgi:plastocyanin
MTLRTIVALASAVLAFAVAGVGSSAARSPSAHATTVKVTAKDYYFVLSTKTVRAGRVTFVIRNTSPAMHDFKIAGHSSRTIGRGQTTRLTVTLKPGRYLYTCTVDSHAELGMRGYLRARRA